MEVQLFVYDLSRGMARTMSRQFLGQQVDAIYHTSIVVNNTEYFFGQGIQQSSRPGTTHHGRPMEIIPLGQTQLPFEVILEYIESMKSVYTPAAYDLFQNNCNNFSNEFAQFLVGRGIPEHITSLPETVLNTPFGQMLRPQLDAAMREVTQAPIADTSLPNGNSHVAGPPAPTDVTPNVAPLTNGSASSKTKKGAKEHGQVYNVTQVTQLDQLLNEARSGCATIFFTSSTCPPCKLVYPTYDQLAAQHAKSILIKVDINEAQEIGSRYQIRATPTFMTFVCGEKQEEFSGADPNRLRSSVELVSNLAFPGHPHASLRHPVPTLQSGSLRPISFTKIPPLDKVIAKMGISSPAVTSMKDFLLARSASSSTHSLPSPSYELWTPFFRSASSTVAPDALFTAIDLCRCLLLDPRVSAHYLTSDSNSNTLLTLLGHVSSLITAGTCPYSLRLVTLQLACVLFAVPQGLPTLFSPLFAPLLASLSASSLLAEPDKPALRSAAASLAFNLAACNYRIRREQGREALGQESQTELVAALLECLGEKGAGAKEGTHQAVVALGFLIYFAEEGGEVLEVVQVMGAKEVVGSVEAEGKVLSEAVRDVGRVLGREE